MVAWTLVAHIFGLTLWVSGLLVTTIAISRHTQEASAEGRQALARLERIFLRSMADPGALLTIVAGIILVASNRSYYLHATWLHIKFVFVLMLIGLHGWIATRSKFLSTGRITLQPGQARTLSVAVLLVFLSILIATLPGEVFLK
jgi:protoporphyrinogen IX oxidase